VSGRNRELGRRGRHASIDHDAIKTRPQSGGTMSQPSPRSAPRRESSCQGCARSLFAQYRATAVSARLSPSLLAPPARSTRIPFGRFLNTPRDPAALTSNTSSGHENQTVGSCGEFVDTIPMSRPSTTASAAVPSNSHRTDPLVCSPSATFALPPNRQPPANHHPTGFLSPSGFSPIGATHLEFRDSLCTRTHYEQWFVQL
jgi:hypothetical protein